ncbi:Scr1 family TA system antitoxin-like transcriptional regulator [Streptomyces sp. NPDC054802]
MGRGLDRSGQGANPGCRKLEHGSIRLWAGHTTHLPGLFQTGNHARAVFGLFAPCCPPVGRTAGGNRLTRQQVVTGGRAKPYVGVIHLPRRTLKVGQSTCARFIAHVEGSGRSRRNR